MKIEVMESFEYGGDSYEEGDTPDMEKSVAESVIDKGYAKEYEEEDEKEIEIEPEEEEEDEIEIEDVPAKTEGAESMGDVNNILDEMEDELDKELEAPMKWNPPQVDTPDPEDHPELIGKVGRVGTSSDYDSRFLSVSTREGKTKSLFEHTALSDLFDADPQSGDLVAVRYIGKEDSEGGRQYLNYRFILRDPDGNKKVEG